MAYVENPIIEGKDFKSVAKDVNGNFDDLKKYIDANIATWEKIGEVNIVGSPSKVSGYSNTTKVLGEKCGSIECHGERYEKIYLVTEGNLPSVTKLKTAMCTSYEGDSYYPDFISNSVSYMNRGGASFVKLWNNGYYDLPSAGIKDTFNFYWLYVKGTSPDNVNVTIKLYGLKKPQWLLDALEIT